MIQVAITAAAYEAIAAALQLGSVGYKQRRRATGVLSAAPSTALDALGQPGEGYFEVILRMAENEASPPVP
jgi:hypothetical protein